ncbi:phytanoyl-CoA dioxygenase family protein [Parahaliea aestuarii]|uniref:Phytanoyl-CoA dioxygenase family protein n=1 Tax=Parahaliea aestuarii TaxID=1852021 RepID=A0A5C8ZSQ8_9GAMM|nr:phytanoyl-CoA dioxygenase family protein [Parahaliea aestuarii]TXS90341.1 phytanoyl-CoA dioxygenase family protein [Parahaliea aestuarii]
MGAKTPEFAPLWTDAENALSILESKLSQATVTGQQAAQLESLIRFGFAIIPQAISTGQADALRQEINSVSSRAEYFLARRARKAYTHPVPDIYDDPTFRLIDFHVNSALAREAIFCEKIVDLLRIVFDDELNAFQCLTFNYGSQQAAHQDTAYVVVSEPLQFLASWIALEDVEPGSGELEYYPGSHKLEHHLFGEASKSWNPEIHGRPAHKAFLDGLISRCEQQGLEATAFLPKKGDALIWASDLVHGGRKMESPRTRYSIVTHYCPSTVYPNFRNFTSYFHLQAVQPHCYISSRHYDLTKRAPSGWWSKLFGRQHFSNQMLKPAFMGQQESD